MEGLINFFSDPSVQKNIALGLSQLIAFLIFLYVLKRFAWRPILKVLDDRQEKITSEFKKIEELEAKFKNLQSEYEQKIKDSESRATTLLQEEIGKGKKEAQSLVDAARKEAQLLVEKGKEQINDELTKAKQDIRKDVMGLVFTVTQKFISKQMNTEENKKQVENFIHEIESKQ